MNFILWTTLSYNHAPIRPVGAYQIASWLRQHGYTVKVIDFCYLMSQSDIIAITEKYIDDTTIAVGVSSTFWTPSEVSKKIENKKNNTEPEWVDVCRTAIQAKYPQLDWILGGGGSSLPFLKHEWIKIHGDGEDEILRYFDQKTSNTTKRSLFDIKTLEKEYHVTDFIDPRETLSIELGRGCQFKCKFCRYHKIGKKPGTYLRSIECVEREMLANYEKFGTTNYYFLDDTVNEDTEKVEQLAALAERLPFQLQWVGYIRMDLLWHNIETVDLLKRSGLRSAFIGVESFHPDASRVIGKGWNGRYGKEFLKYLRKQWGYDRPFFLSFIVGLPGEDKQSLMETYNWLKDNNFTSWAFYPLNIYRNSTSVWKSEFDNNYSEYGFRFPNPMSDIYWESDDWNTDSAIEFSVHLNSLKKRTETSAGWSIADFSNLGYSIPEIVEKPFAEYDWDEVHRRKNQMIKTYIEKSLNYDKNKH